MSAASRNAREALELMTVSELRLVTAERLTAVMSSLIALHLLAIARGDYETARDADEAVSIFWELLDTHPDLLDEGKA